MNFVPRLQDEDNAYQLFSLASELELMSDQLPQQRGVPPAATDSMNTSNISQLQPSQSSEANHGTCPCVRSQASLADTAGNVDRTYTETHYNPRPVYASTHNHSNTSRPHGQINNEEERHRENYPTPSSKRPARDQQQQDNPSRVSISKVQDKASSTRESSNTNRNLRKKIQMRKIGMGQMGININSFDVHLDHKQSEDRDQEQSRQGYSEAGVTKLRT